MLYTLNMDEVKSTEDYLKEAEEILKEICQEDWRDEYFVDSILGLQGKIKNYFIRKRKEQNATRTVNVSKEA